MLKSNQGISLRFPRLLRLRDDKSPEQATTSDQVSSLPLFLFSIVCCFACLNSDCVQIWQVADMYRSQKINHGYNQEDEDDD